ncbi:MAG TPA: Holliday junction resolvase RuvX [Candidatus Paceibacterota bacterium]|jgi:putative Holliday junction resolvase
MRHIGIDYGHKKVGIALSDEAGTMGFPHAILQNTSGLVDDVVRLIEEKNVGAIVIGESRDFSGKDNPIAAEARSFAEALRARTGVPVFYEPELFTTQEARRFPDGTRSPGSPDVDSSAAALILTSYLERSAGV